MTVLTFRDVPVDVAVDGDEGLGPWLREFLWPMFEHGPGAGVPLARARVHVRAATVSSIDPHTGTTADYTPSGVIFALDGEPTRAREARTPDGVRLWKPPPATLVLDITSDRARVTLRHAGSTLNTRARAMRVVREYAHNRAVAAGHVVLHAASVALDGRAIAIAGPKQAGKTTLLLTLLTTANVELIANDRTLVQVGSALLASAMPTVISLRPGTRALFRDLTNQLSASGDFRMRESERLAFGPCAPESLDDAWHFSHRQVAQATERPARDCAPLDTVLFPTPGMAAGGAPRRLTDREAAAALAGAVLGARHGVYTSDYFIVGNQRAPTHEDMADCCRGIAARVRCFAVPWTTGTDVRRMLDTCAAR